MKNARNIGFGVVMLVWGALLVAASNWTRPTNANVDKNGNHVPTGIPSEFRDYSSTKAAKSMDVRQVARIRVQPSAANSFVYLNGRGNGWPIAANTSDLLPIYVNVSTVTFKGASTAVATKNRFRVQVM